MLVDPCRATHCKHKRHEQGPGMFNIVFDTKEVAYYEFGPEELTVSSFFLHRNATKKLKRRVNRVRPLTELEFVT